MIPTKESQRVAKLINFQRDTMLKHPVASDMPTAEDIDEMKLPALEKLLTSMFEFYWEMYSVGITPQENSRNGYSAKSLYRLTNPLYSNQCKFQIILESRWFEPDWVYALHSGFVFYLYVEQKIHPEISDWLKIEISYLDTVPMSFVSSREYSGNKYLQSFYKGRLFFNSFNLGEEERNNRKEEDGLSFKTSLFNKSVDDTCLILHEIMRYKENFSVLPPS